MVEVGTKFSLINRKTSVLAIMYSIAWVVSLVVTVRVLTNFSVVFLQSFVGSGQVGNALFHIISTISSPFLTILILTSPFRYVAVQGGVRVDCIWRRKVLLFSDMEHVLLESDSFPVHLFRWVPIERMSLSTKVKTAVVISVTNDFDKLYDYIVESVDPSIVEDKRTTRESG